MLRWVIFQKNCVVNGNIMQFIPFVRAFYAYKSPLFYNHYSHKGNVTTIPFAMETHQSDPLEGALFTLAHLRLYVL